MGAGGGGLHRCATQFLMDAKPREYKPRPGNAQRKAKKGNQTEAADEVAWYQKDGGAFGGDLQVLNVSVLRQMCARFSSGHDLCEREHRFIHNMLSVHGVDVGKV